MTNLYRNDIILVYPSGLLKQTMKKTKHLVTGDWRQSMKLPMARLPWLIRTRFEFLRNSSDSSRV